VSSSTIGPGPAALKWLREISGLTQRDLAARSGVSERTVRGLERGEVERPHHASLVALAEAAGLNPAETGTFLRAWSPARRRTFSELFGDTGLDDALAEASLRTGYERAPIALWNLVVIGPNRRIRRTGHRSVFESLYDGLTGHTMVHTGDDPEEFRFCEVTKATGVSVRSRSDIPDRGLVAFDLDFDHPLARGETYAYAITIDREARMDAQDAEARCPGPESDGYLRGVRSATSLIVLRVVFEGDPPTYVWDLRGRSMTDYTEGARAPMGERTVLDLVVRHAEPGSYGFGWSWGP
jgi:transcriptional regulator with XRE-family HTH domain